MDRNKKIKFIVIVAAFATLILIVLANIFQMTQVSEKDFKTYRQGLTYLNANDFENAYYNFTNVSKNSAIYEIALLRQAICADNLNDYETAIKKYRLFIEKYPDSMFIQKAYYALAQNYFRAKDYNRAEKTFHSIRKLFKDSEYTIASNYYLGAIYKEKAIEKEKAQKDDKDILPLKQKAKTYFAEYLKTAPNGRLAKNCSDEMQNLKIPFNQRDYYLLGRMFFKNGLYKSAYDNLNKSYMSAGWGYLGEIYKKQGNYKKYIEIFEHNYPLYSKNCETEELYTFLQNYAQSYPQGPKAGWYRLLDLSNNNAQGIDYILYMLTKYETENTKEVLYSKIYKEFPKGQFAADALANVFWSKYTKKQYDEAFSLGLIHLKEYQNTISAPKVIFWMGKLAQRQGNYTEAKGFYQRIIDNYPDDYYAYRASKHLNYSYNNGWKTKSSHRLNEKQQIIKFPIKHTSIVYDNISLIDAILKLNDYKLMGEIDKDNKAIQSWINYKEGKITTAAYLARDAISEMSKKPEFSDSIYKLAYPLQYQKIINEQSKLYRLDPYLVSALIREESYFNSKAGSAAGARGLMQLMPGTAYYIANKNGIYYTGANSLYDPETNIELGCAYLDYAKERLHENDMLAVASYNGGPNAVRQWKSSLEYKNFDEFIENIPYPETRDYIKKVYRSYWVYINIY